MEGLEQRGFVQPFRGHERQNLINDASQKAVERFDEAMRELALLRVTEFERELGPSWCEIAVAGAVRRWRECGDLAWPKGANEQQEIDELAQRLAPKYGPGWPSLLRWRT